MLNPYNYHVDPASLFRGNERFKIVDWFEDFESAVELVVNDMNENGWAMMDEDEDFTWDEVMITVTRMSDYAAAIKQRTRMRSRGKTCRVQLDPTNGTLSCYDANGDLVSRIAYDTKGYDVYAYINQIVAGG